MEEDIKVLEEFIEQYNTDEDLFCFINYSTIQAIENLIKGYKELEKQLQDIHDNFCKFNWKESNGEQVYYQLKELYESIYRNQKGDK